jgi:hypothetical protein
VLAGLPEEEFAEYFVGAVDQLLLVLVLDLVLALVLVAGLEVAVQPSPGRVEELRGVVLAGPGHHALQGLAEGRLVLHAVG